MRMGTASHTDGTFAGILGGHACCPATKFDVLRTPPEDVLVALAVFHVLVPVVDQHGTAPLRPRELNRRGVVLCLDQRHGAVS